MLTIASQALWTYCTSSFPILPAASGRYPDSEGFGTYISSRTPRNQACSLLFMSSGLPGAVSKLPMTLVIIF